METSKKMGELLDRLPNQTTPNSKITYPNLNAETLALVQEHTHEIKVLIRRTAEDIINIGQRLIEVKKFLGHGNFTNWLKVEFNWSISTATKFMHVAEHLKFVNFTNLNISASALYIIAAPSTSKEARAEVLKRAVIGENITYTQAKEIVNKYKGNVPSQPCNLENTNIGLKTIRPNSSNSLQIEDHETTSIFYLPDDLASKGIKLKNSFPLFERQSFSRENENSKIVNFSKIIVYDQKEILDNEMNSSSSLDNTQLNSLINKTAITLTNLTPEQLALVLAKSVDLGLSDRHLQSLVQICEKLLKTP
ncbi:DUF3102 domain-containing protein [Nostoc punctiforme]|uniref:DUF3102 domain-containing protein n=1 Tax=Nostoc punctiforme (strain ATCC 29133 / PCC 73102) TaxID=63737 RepID=B2IXK2_NOSP7|nr:DUF3102 domain-containing protein [Nostoc punctiforme]ACC81530.1 hypothetical protein Npun_R3028 [Nostoc punctiforme PCC 73102]